MLFVTTERGCTQCNPVEVVYFPKSRQLCLGIWNTLRNQCFIEKSMMNAILNNLTLYVYVCFVENLS